MTAAVVHMASSIQDRIRAIRALLSKLANVEAKLQHATRKADEYQRTIGQHIAAIKSTRPRDWEKIVKDDCGLARSRAYELMAIADGTKTAEQVRDQNNTRKIKHRKAVRSGNGREPLSDCPLCEGKGSFGPVDIYSPCGSIRTTGMRPDCDCLTMKRRGNPSLYDDLRAKRAKLDALPASERTTKVGTSIVTKDAPPPEAEPKANGAPPPASVVNDLVLLRRFARFVIDRATVKVPAEHYREWKELLGPVKLTLQLHEQSEAAI